MSRILSANLFRLRRSGIFKWTLFLTTLVTAIATVYNCLSIHGEMSEYSLETISLSTAPFIQIICAAVIILFLGTDYSEKTVRNKLFVGSARNSIYLANLITGIIIGCSINAAWLVGGLAGLPILGAWKMPLYQVLTYVLISMLCTVSVSAVTTMICMLLRRKSIAVASTLVTIFAMIIIGSQLCDSLNQPEEYMSASVVDGDMVFNVEQNSQYIGGAKRTVYEIAVHTIPLGTSIMLSNCNLENPLADAAGSVFVTVYISAVGAAVFRRKDMV